MSLYDLKKSKISQLSNRLLTQKTEFNESQFLEDNDEEDEDEHNQNYDSDDEHERNQSNRLSIKYQLQTQRIAYSKARLRSHEGFELKNKPSLSMANYMFENSANISKDSDQINRNDGKKFSFEQFLEKVGTENWYQIRLFSCFCLQWFVVGWFIISQNFLFQQVKYIDHYDKEQKIGDMCNNGEISMDDTSNLLLPNQFYSISVEFRLYCKRDYLRQIIGFSQSVFGILGYIFFGYLSDNYGRKHGLKLAWKIFAIGQIIQCSTKVLPLVMAGYCLSSFGALSVVIIQISLINEQSTGIVRVMSGIGLNIGFSIAQTIFTAFAYIIHDWRILMVICGVIPTLVLNFMISIYEESPRYYYLKNKQKALRLLNRIALINEKKTLNVDLERSTWTEEWRDKNRKYRDLFQYLSVRISILGGSMIFFSTEMLFKAGEITLEKNTLSTYEKVIILSLADAVASFVALFAINRLKRKKQLYISCAIAAISICVFYLYTNLFTTTQIDDSPLIRTFQIIIGVISRFSSNYLRTVAFVYFAELFPTVIRSMGMAVLFACSQLGSITVYLMQMREFNDILYVIPIAFCSIVAVVHIYWLPDINFEKQPIRDEIPEIAFGHDDKFYLDETEDQ